MYKLMQILSPCSKAASNMLSDNVKALLHEGHLCVRRKTYSVEACMRRRQTVNGPIGVGYKNNDSTQKPQEQKIDSTIPKPDEPKVSIKYPEFINYKTRGIIKGTDNGVHYAPEVTLNILSLGLLKQQGFGIIFEGDRCILVYMFKDRRGKNIDIDKMRQQHNDYLDDYFDSLDNEANIQRRIEPLLEETNDEIDIHTFQECVAFLNLIKEDEGPSKNGRITGTNLTKSKHGYLSVQFGEEFGALAEILGLTRSDGKEIQKCYIDYLEALVSYYKTTRSSGDPIRGNEDLESFKSYRCDGNRDDTMDAENGKERVEHFGITLEDEGIDKHKPFADHKEDELKIKCYKCQSAGHFNFECSSMKNQDPFATYNGASTSRPIKEEDTQSTSSGDFTIIT
nr:ARID DNA-binding domain-containing protein [Tanacetum cinerariifolium]